MLEIMTKERLKKGGEVKKREQSDSSKPGSDSAADDDARRGKDLVQPHAVQTRCLIRKVL